MKQKYLTYEKCGNIISIIKDTKISPMYSGGKMNRLVPGKPDASFEKLEAVYAYCNLHGLWVNKNE
jgi:superoxide reductase